MTVVTPPLFQNIDATHTAADLGLPYRDLIAEGVAGSGDLAVSERGAGANMSVDVAAGVAWVKGDTSDLQPCYRCYNDATVNLAIAAADGTNARIDLVIAEVRDAVFSGVSTDWRLRVITGTPAGSPSAPSTPDNAIALARIGVPASDTAIGDAQITDVRPLAGVGDLGVPLVDYLPTALQAYDGQVIDYLADATNGVVWRFRYRAASGSSYKWEFIGGPPLSSVVATSESRSNSSYGALTTPGPSVTVPLAGDYDISLAARMISPSGQLAQFSYDIGGTGAVDGDALHAGGSASTVDAFIGRPDNRKTIAAASTVLLAKYRSTSGGAATFSDRRISIRPVRVG